MSASISNESLSNLPLREQASVLPRALPSEEGSAPKTIFTILSEDIHYLTTLMRADSKPSSSIFQAAPGAFHRFGQGIVDYLSKRDNQIHLIQMLALSTLCGFVGKGIASSWLRSRGVEVVERLALRDLALISMSKPSEIALRVCAGVMSMGVNAGLFTAINSLISGQMPHSFVGETAHSASQFSVMHFLNWGLAPLGPVPGFLLGGLIFNAAPLVTTVITNSLGLTHESLEQFLDPQEVLNNTALHLGNTFAAGMSHAVFRQVGRIQEASGKPSIHNQLRTVAHLLEEKIARETADFQQSLHQAGCTIASFGFALSSAGGLGGVIHGFFGKPGVELEFRRRGLIESNKFKAMHETVRPYLEAWIRPELETRSDFSPEERLAVASERTACVEELLDALFENDGAKKSSLSPKRLETLRDGVLSLLWHADSAAQKRDVLNHINALRDTFCGKTAIADKNLKRELQDFLKKRAVNTVLSPADVAGIPVSKVQSLIDASPIASATAEEIKTLNATIEEVKVVDNGQAAPEATSTASAPQEGPEEKNTTQTIEAPAIQNAQNTFLEFLKNHETRLNEALRRTAQAQFLEILKAYRGENSRSKKIKAGDVNATLEAIEELKTRLFVQLGYRAPQPTPVPEAPAPARPPSNPPAAAPRVGTFTTGTALPARVRTTERSTPTAALPVVQTVETVTERRGPSVETAAAVSERAAEARAAREAIAFPDWLNKYAQKIYADLYELREAEKAQTEKSPVVQIFLSIEREAGPKSISPKSITPKSITPKNAAYLLRRIEDLGLENSNYALVERALNLMRENSSLLAITNERSRERGLWPYLEDIFDESCYLSMENEIREKAFRITNGISIVINLLDGKRAPDLFGDLVKDYLKALKNIRERENVNGVHLPGLINETFANLRKMIDSKIQF